MPYDFFNLFNSESNEDLNWYWKNWFFERNHADLEIEAVETNQIWIKNKGKLFLPIRLFIEYQDGSMKKIEKDLSAWKNSKGSIAINLEDFSQLKSITLGDKMILDVDGSNNHWEK